MRMIKIFYDEHDDEDKDELEASNDDEYPIGTGNRLIGRVPRHGQNFNHIFIS